jgi:exodeoxyribonuclease VII small subunit
VSKKTQQKLKFEEAIKRLEEIVTRLEEGDVPLDESLSLFEEGVALSRHCSALLDGASQKVSMLENESIGLQTQFEAEET